MPRSPHEPPAHEPHAARDDVLPEAFDLWREDTARAAAQIDVAGDLADRVVAAARAGRPPRLVPAGARLYAAAAVLLMAVGITGTILARDTAASASAGAPRWADLDDTLVNVLVDDPRYAPDLEGN